MRALPTDTPRRSFEAAKTFERPLPGHALFLQNIPSSKRTQLNCILSSHDKLPL
jgi:hypothetical protein